MSAEKGFISIISTHAKDRLIDGNTKNVIKEQAGGPILYIESALKKLGIEPSVYSAEEMLVEIMVYPNDEFGKIHEPKLRRLLPKLQTESVIVSTLLDEWDLSNASDYKGRIFLDIQGYVRDGSAFGKKKAWKDAETLSKTIFCLKGNNIEVDNLSKEVVVDQSQNRMLIITKDSAGVEIHYVGVKYEFSPTNVIKPKHTIGAGDTWFANFVAKFMETENVEISAKFAIEETSKFLSELE